MLRWSLVLRPSVASLVATRHCELLLPASPSHHLLPDALGGWARDWKPGPVPRTPEERAAAARKYNLIPEDYDVNDESLGFGDYPKLPAVGMDARDPYEDLDYHYHRRNYGETVCSLCS